jgi:hypothetical protein
MSKKMTPAHLAGIALYSDSSEEILTAINSALAISSVDLFCVSAESIGHLARRFQIEDSETLKRLMLCSERFSNQRDIHDSIVSMFDDIENFIPDTKTKRPNQFRDFLKL